MQAASLLNAAKEIALMSTGYTIDLDFLGQFARVIIEGIGIIGLGIIVFTLVLKAITLPFDIYQRFSMRKQTLVMRSMQDDLDKLQKQYANDKSTYNQKMLELQKKNGYSMLGACLPMIVSLVILIVAFQGFRAYAEYANLQTFEVMSEQYNAAILGFGAEGKDYRAPREGVEDDGLTRTFTDGETWTEDGVVYSVRTSATENGEVFYLKVTPEDPEKFLFYEYALETNPRRVYYVDPERFLASAYFAETVEESERAEISALEGEERDARILSHVERLGALAAAEYFHTEGPGFLWIGNVWYPDVSYDHPIPDYDTLTGQITSVDLPDGTEDSFKNVLQPAMYEKLIAELGEETDAANGYFILIILSVGLMVVSQLISMKSNKENNKYQTVDGRGAMTQKVMLVVMPLIYGMFAFLMSAAFSIYMIVSSIVAILVTLLSNLIIGHIFKKKEEAKFKEEHNRTLPWMDNYGKKGKGGKKEAPKGNAKGDPKSGAKGDAKKKKK